MKLRSLFAALALSAVSFASFASTVQLVPDADPQVGQFFDVKVRLDKPFEGLAANEELLTFGFSLDYDHSLLNFDSFQIASGWSDDTIFLNPGQFGGSSFPGVANEGQNDLFLATLRFSVLGTGTGHVSISSDLSDFNLGLNYYKAGPLDMSASMPLTVSPVPEPASALLFAAGVAALAGRRRKQGGASAGLAAA